MTRNQIIHNLFTGKNFRDCISKMQPEHLQEDLKMEVALVVCEWSDDKVLFLHAEGKLEFYVVRVIINMISNKSSQFYKKFRQPAMVQYHEDVRDCSDEDELVQDYRKLEPVPYISQDEIRDREIREALEDLTLQEIDKLYWYDAELIKIYMKVGNFRAIQAETGIPWVSCYKSIKKAMATLKQKAEEARPIFTEKELLFIKSNKS